MARSATLALVAMVAACLGSCFVQAPISSSLPRMGLSTQPRFDASQNQSTATPTWPVVALAGVAALTGALRKSKVQRKASLIATRPDQAIPWWDRLTKPRMEPGIGIWAEKLNMTQIFEEEEGNVKIIPATILVIKKGGNIVVDKFWPEKHGHYAVTVGYEHFKAPEDYRRPSHTALKVRRLERNDIPPLRKLKTFRTRPWDWEKWTVGQKIWPSDFLAEGDWIDVHGKSKGKGFQGRIKRWGGKRGQMGHGSKHHRREGSIGAARPKRVLPCKKRHGWMGAVNHTVKNLKILKIMDRIDEDNMPESIIVVKGAVPGYTAHWLSGGSYLYLHKSKDKYARKDGRFKRDPVWLWYYYKGEDVDPMVPIPEKAWTWKTMFGRDLRWLTDEVKKYWPDGFPGYDHTGDPFYDDCDPHEALKAPEW